MKIRLTSQKKPFLVDLKAHKDYLFCTCEKSENQPFCDQRSHRGTGKVPFHFSVDKDGKYFLCGCKKSTHLPYCDATHKKL